MWSMAGAVGQLFMRGAVCASQREGFDARGFLRLRLLPPVSREDAKARRDRGIFAPSREPS